jgi:predicted phosphodiesterase
MRLGILADIHEEVEWLALALEQFRQTRVDQVVVLGDVFYTGERMGPTVELLRQVNPVSVWGNHDFGLCYKQEQPVREKYAGPILDFMKTLRPRLEIEGCLFTHVEPWQDPTDVEQLWWFDGHPNTAERAARSFEARSNRIMVIGHFHRWLILTPQGLLPWDGNRSITLPPPERYLVAVAAVCDGRCAIFDTASSELIPYNLAAS